METLCAIIGVVANHALRRVRQSIDKLTDFQALHDMWPVMAILIALQHWTSNIPLELPPILTEMRDRNIYYKACSAVRILTEWYPDQKQQWKELLGFFIEFQARTKSPQAWHQCAIQAFNDIRRVTTIMDGLTQHMHAHAWWIQYVHRRQSFQAAHKMLMILRTVSKTYHAECQEMWSMYLLLRSECQETWSLYGLHTYFLEFLEQIGSLHTMTPQLSDWITEFLE